MAQVKPTPEEQLLGLIEQGEDSKPRRRLRRKKTPFLDLSKIGSFLPFFKNRSALQSQRKLLDIRIINRFLIGMSIVLAGCFAVDFVNSIRDISQTLKKPVTVKPNVTREDVEEDVRPFLYYFEMGQRRNIFSPMMLKSAETNKAESEKMLKTLMNDLALMGIFWAEEPQVVIEHKGEKKTYFLKTGDMVNKLKIIDILKDRVILDYDGETAELM
jgi:hypothetical protein